MAGGRNVLSTPGQQAPWIEWDVVRGANPQTMLVMPCGFGRSSTRPEAGALARLPGWDDLDPVRAGRVYLTDGHQHFNRPGPRLVESLEIMAGIPHPEHFDLGHRPRHNSMRWPRRG